LSDPLPNDSTFAPEHMDWLTFIAAIVKALAWPLTVLGVFAVLRRPLLGLIPLVARLKFKDLELDFGRRLAEVRAEAESLPGVPSAAPTESDDTLLRLAAMAPRATVRTSAAASTAPAAPRQWPIMDLSDVTGI